jgi:hypothetical protein
MKTGIEMCLEFAAKYHNEGRWTLAAVWRAKAARLAAGKQH